MHSNRLLELASVISTSVISINDCLGLKGLPTPSFDPDAPRILPDEIDAARNAVLDATSELHDLLLEPADLLRTLGSHANLISLHAIQRFKIASSFAVGDQVSFAHIATSCNQSELNIRRLLRYAMTLRVFREPRKGFVAHTAASRLLADPCMLDWLGNTCEETWPAATVDAMCKWPGSEEPNHCGFSLANDTQDSMYQSMARNPARARRFAGAMAAYTTGKGYDNSHLLDNYDWTSLGNGLIVDVGGSHGHISVSIAQRYDHLNFVVQDLKEIISEAASELPGNLTARVKFMAHDFLTDQPVRAHLYYFRWIFHNWSDKYCIRILRCLVPALRPGARILIHDSCMPELNTAPKWREKMLRSMDIGMLAILNAREREFEDWQELFQQADHRFKFLGVIKPKGANLAIIEARWEGEGVERQEKGLLN